MDLANLISLKDAVKYLPKRSGKKVHYSTIFRWATKGAPLLFGANALPVRAGAAIPVSAYAAKPWLWL